MVVSVPFFMEAVIGVSNLMLAVIVDLAACASVMIAMKRVIARKPTMPHKIG